MILDRRWWWCVSASLPHDVQHDERKKREKCCTHTHSGMNWVGQHKTHSLVTYCAEEDGKRVPKWKKESTPIGALIARLTLDCRNFGGEEWFTRFSHSLSIYLGKQMVLGVGKKEREMISLVVVFSFEHQECLFFFLFRWTTLLTSDGISQHVTDIELLPDSHVSCCYRNNWHEYRPYRYSISLTHDSLVGELHRLSGIKCFTYSETRITGLLLLLFAAQHKRYGGGNKNGGETGEE